MIDVIRQEEAFEKLNDMEKVRLKYCFDDIVGGGTPSRNISEYWKDDIPWCTVKDFKGKNLLYETKESISKKGLEFSSAKVIKKNSLIIPTRMAVGQIAINMIDMAINQDLKGCTVKGDYDINYILFSYVANCKKIEDLSSGSTVKGIDLKTLNNIEIKNLKKEMQKKISTFLIALDSLIQKQEEYIELLKIQKKGYSQKMFNQKNDFEQFVGKSEIKQLQEIATITMGQSPISNYYNNDKIGKPLIQGNADIANRKTAPRIYSEFGTKESIKGSIIMSVRAPVGVVARSTGNYYIGRGVVQIESKINEYIYQYLIWHENRWGFYSTGSTFESIDSKTIRELEIILHKNYIEISNFLHGIDKKIELQVKKLELLKLKKKYYLKAIFN